MDIFFIKNSRNLQKNIFSYHITMYIRSNPMKLSKKTAFFLKVL